MSTVVYKISLVSNLHHTNFYIQRKQCCVLIERKNFIHFVKDKKNFLIFYFQPKASLLWLFSSDHFNSFFNHELFTLEVNTFEEDSRGFITWSCLSCELVSFLLTHWTHQICIRLWFLHLGCNLSVFQIIFFKPFLNNFLNLFKLHFFSNKKKIYILFFFTSSLCSFVYSVYIVQFSRQAQRWDPKTKAQRLKPKPKTRLVFQIPERSKRAQHHRLVQLVGRCWLLCRWLVFHLLLCKWLNPNLVRATFGPSRFGCKSFVCSQVFVNICLLLLLVSHLEKPWAYSFEVASLCQAPVFVQCFLYSLLASS